MRHLTIVALLLALGSVEARAATHTITTTTAQEAILTRARNRDNAQTCTRLGLPASCTQAQASAVDAAAVIYADNDAFILALVRDALKDRKQAQDNEDVASFDAAWSGASAATKNGICSALSLPNGCKP